ncbi:quinone-dependent dihydroorotate dehydrogenase [Salinisphaera sp.]|uniref:quinone-dependent dihydroorotate dehydrogenase n=1 Tax=Salinisphaera sp. TaxID=1914330 RepID=UPI002D785E55|nr:quinone-dependent dihydroorotate dehydrogenase [Salinisphaera sp.]HET7314534.1 quinone-dependent dihydroorotate dehydrogenase [Salinisphaera sp.]
MYSLIRPALFRLEPERAHALTLDWLSRMAPAANRLYGARIPSLPTTVMGLTLPNPVGLAAGLDKDAAHIDGLGALGFGFVEVGTVTPEPQPGNDRPRLFRLPEQRALLNRFGFNNAGAEALAANLARARFGGIVGVNIGKNKATPAERAVADYTSALAAVYDRAHYVTLNVSSPNTAGLRDWQGADALDGLLTAVVAERNRWADMRGRYVPLALKIAPDLDEAGVDAIVARLRHHRIDGVIATNTTTARDALPPAWREQAGGVSGRPVRAASNRVIAALKARLGDDIPIIGVGGIMSGADAAAKIAAGACAVQLYTGLIYRGPALVREAVSALRAQRDSALAASQNADR